MAVRDALLALLTVGPAYGFQVHNGLETRTGGRRRVNVGQTYATLERLTKQGLIESAGTTDDGLPLHRLTTAGEAAAAAWLGGADASGADPWDETVDRVLIARSLPDQDAAAVVAAEHERWMRRRAEASARVAGAPTAGSADGVDGAGTREDDVVAEAGLAKLAAAADRSKADAALAWLDVVEATPAAPFPPRTTRPKRGRRPTASPVDHTAQESALA